MWPDPAKGLLKCRCCQRTIANYDCNDRQLLSTKYYEPHAFYRKHFWCFSTFRTKNIHIYLVCCCQRTIATIDISFRDSITSGTRFIENISGVLLHLERRCQRTIAMIDISFRAIFPFEQELRAARVSSVAGSARLLRSIFLFGPVLRAARAIYRKHFWCFPHLERRIYTYILSVSHTLCSLQARITNRTRLYSKVVYCWLNEMHELRIERSVNTNGLLRVKVNFSKSP